MKELSLHIIDILQNSITAGATLITLNILEDEAADLLSFTITDNGCGMDQEMVKRVIDPFTTGRTTRRVGLGIPLLKLAAENTGGGITLTSKVGEGTVITARFGYHHIDREPLGDMAETVHQAVTAHEEIDFLYTHKKNNNSFSMDTRELKNILSGVPFHTPEVSLWILEYLREGEESL